MPLPLEEKWQNAVRGFWFYPGAIALGFAVAAYLLVRVDRAAGTEGISLAFDGDGEAARTILSTVAGSLITVAGLAFSITIVTLQLVSSQFTPRALRSFLGTAPASSWRERSSGSSRTASSSSAPFATPTSRRAGSCPR